MGGKRNLLFRRQWDEKTRVEREMQSNLRFSFATSAENKRRSQTNRRQQTQVWVCVCLLFPSSTISHLLFLPFSSINGGEDRQKDIGCSGHFPFVSFIFRQGGQLQRAFIMSIAIVIHEETHQMERSRTESYSLVSFSPSSSHLMLDEIKLDLHSIPVPLLSFSHHESRTTVWPRID